MKHFILEGKHLAPFKEFAHLEPRHHEFMQQGYGSGAFLFSGPHVPPHGGFLAARAQSREQLDALLAQEPFVKGGFMRFTSVMEFNPVQYQSVLREWFAGAPVDDGRKQITGIRDSGSAVKHFLLEGEHIVPFEQRDPVLITAHRAFLEEGYRRGRFLLSGPTIPPWGGFLVARAGSLQELNDMLAEEPYIEANVMRFSRITEFDPAQNAPLLNDWFQKT
jgi:uncharacterized protein YciI